MATQKTYYSFQKGKHGGTAGYILPFFTPLQSLFPDSEYEEIIPAGFLKCQGQVLPASRYRALAQQIGIGASCIYRREGITLEDPDENGEGGQIQLPDLGSKYIAGSLNPGLYQNDEAGTTDRAGIGVELFSLGDNIEFFYQGDFRVPGRPVTISGNVTAVSPPAITEETELQQSNYLPHGHNTTFSVARRINTNTRAIQSAQWRANNYYCGRRGQVCFSDTNFGVVHAIVTLDETGTSQGATHFHQNALPRIDNETKSASIAETLVPASPLVTTVNLRTNTVVKMDEFAPRYILCEYLIKY